MVALNRVSLFLLAGVLCTAPASSQALIPDDVSCPKCTIDTRVVTRIGTADGPGGLPGMPDRIVFDGRARYWVSYDEFFPLVYDANGRFIREFGKKGGGPGEFERVFAVSALPGDSVLVADHERFVVVAGDFSQERVIRNNADRSIRQVIGWPNSVFAMRWSDDQSRGSYSWGFVDLSGANARNGRTLYSLNPGRTGAEYAAVFRVSSPSARDHFWIADLSRYRIVRYSTQGMPQDSLERRLRWFPGGQGMGWGSKTRPPPPTVLQVWEDYNGLLWTVIAEPRSDYAKAWEGRRPMTSEVSARDLPAYDKLWRSMIEVIDPRTKRVLARRTLDAYVVSMLPANRIATYAENEDGIPIITVHQLTLNRN